MTDTNRQYGIYLERHASVGSEHVTARVVAREGDTPHPMGVGSSYQWPKGLHFDNLGIDGFVSELNDYQYIGHNPEYREPYAIGIRDAKRMVGTLNRIWKRIERDNAREPGDMLYAMCQALKLSFVCVATTKNYGSGRWDDQDYRWMTIGEGRNEFRRMIAEAISDVRAKLKPAA